MSARVAPTRTLEQQAHAAGANVIAAADECGRGSAAGPLCVGVVIPGEGTPPAGLADSKLLTARARARLEPEVLAWVREHAFGMVSAAEIDEGGMAAALTLAAHRALSQLRTPVDLVLLDGPYDYIGAPYTVWPRIKADQTEIAVAAASILAKEHRDRLMIDLDAQIPGYGLARNAGYLSAAHRTALADLGPTSEHRTSWRYMDDLPQWAHLRRGPGDPGGPTLRA